MKRYTLGRREVYDDVVGKTFKKGRTAEHEGGSIWDTPREAITYWITAQNSSDEWWVYLVDVEDPRTQLTEKNSEGWRELLVDSPIFAAEDPDRVSCFADLFDELAFFRPEDPKGIHIAEFLFDRLYEMWSPEVTDVFWAARAYGALHFTFKNRQYTIDERGELLAGIEPRTPFRAFSELLESMTGEHVREALWKGLCMFGVVATCDHRATCPKGFPGCNCADALFADPILEQRLIDRMAEDFAAFEEEGK